MWVDKYLDFGEMDIGETLKDVSATGNALVGDVIDFGQSIQYYNRSGAVNVDDVPNTLGHPMAVLIIVSESAAIASGKAATIELRGHNTISSGNIKSTGTSTFFRSPNLTAANFKEDSIFGFYLPQSLSTGTPRYLQWWCQGTGDMTAGKFKSMLILDAPIWTAKYASPPAA